MTLEADIAQSRDFEMRTFLQSMRAMYETALLQNDEVYDTAYKLTEGFKRINAAAILADSRIIKTLRYCVAPSISQMKFGQLFGRNTIEDLERSKLTEHTLKHKELSLIAHEIARFASENIDKKRFCWITDNCEAPEIAKKYAKMWTCSLAADQNAQTTYRNWRKEQQERAVIDHLVQTGYVKSAFRGIVENQTDIDIGEYTQEIKVKGRTIQKADVVFRSKKTRKLVLLEAKAVGVELDAVKRIKECCDKANDWTSSAKLGTPDIVAVIAGFFTASNIANLQASNIFVVWEHRLSEVKEKA